jgi:predicted glycosyltransferase
MAKTNSRFLFYMGHPAHFHNVKVVATALIAQGCAVKVIARQKDVLQRLLSESEFDTEYLPPRKGRSRIGLLVSVLKRWVRMFAIVRRFGPDIMIGTDIVIAQLGKVLRIPSVLLNEDDLDQVRLFAKYGVRFADVHLAPDVCRVKGYEHKTLHYKSYHELAYLHPNHFTPDKEVLRPFFNPDLPFFILRFAQLTAYHDKGKEGIDDQLALKLIDLLSPHGAVYITSERPFGDALEPFRISIPPSLMHHALAFARIYIGDSQTMAAEAAVLGTPSVRFNDFVGKLSYLDELELRYGLTTGISTNNPEKLMDVVSTLLAVNHSEAAQEEKRATMLREKKDLAGLWISFFLNFPHRQDIDGFFRK